MQNLPVTQSTISAAHLGVWLQQHYGLSTATTCRLFRTGINHLYLVADGAKQYVFRIYTHGWRSLNEVAEEVRLLNHLRSSNVPVSYPVADTKGGYISAINAPEGCRYGVMFSFASGSKRPRLLPQDAFAIGVVMARLHEATLDFSLQRATYNAALLLQDSLTAISSFFDNNTAGMDFVRGATTYLTAAYGEIPANSVRYGAVHMDIWFDNMHIDDDGAVTLFDFDFCGNGFLCHDIAFFLERLYATNADERDYEEKAAAFLAGYESVTGISEEEKRIIPYLSLSTLVYYLGIQCSVFDTWSNVFLNEDHLKRFTGQMKKWAVYNGFDMPLVKASS